MKTIIVCAGNYDQFRRFKSEQGKHAENATFLFASHPGSWCGKRADALVIVGTFWTDQPSAEDIYVAAMCRLSP
jgi:hypothetical protein